MSETDIYRLNNFVEISRTGINPSAFADEYFLYYSIPNLDEYHSPSTTQGKSIGSNKLITKNDSILISKLNPRIQRVWHVQNDDKLRSVASTEFVDLRCKEGAYPRYIYYLLHIDGIYSRLRACAVGTTNSHSRFNPDIILSLDGFIPQGAEQRKIARILSTLDRLIEKTEALIAKYQSIKAGLLQDLLTRGIDVNGELRPPYEEAPDLYKESILGRIPRQWEITTIEKVIEGRPRNGHSPQESDEFTGTMMLGLGCLTFDGFKPIQLKNAPEGDPKIKTALLEEGDLLISRSNTRDLVALVGRYKNIGVPCSYPDLMMRLRVSKEIVPEFLEYTLRFYPVRRQLTSAARGTSGSMVKINSDMVCNTLIPRLDIKEQNKILQVISRTKAPLDAEEDNLQKLFLLKSGLMQDLLTGRVRVTPDREDEESEHV